MKFKLPSFFALLFCMVGLFWSTATSAQKAGKPAPPPPSSPSDCKLGCTSNDVTIVKSYLSDANGNKLGTNFVCPQSGSASVYLTLELITNTPRVGVVIFGEIWQWDPVAKKTVGSAPLKTMSECFGDTLNKPTNKVTFKSTFNWTCGTPIAFTKVFIGWGTGNTNFCTSDKFQCPGTSSKCFQLGDDQAIGIETPSSNQAGQTKCESSPGSNTAVFDLKDSDNDVKGSQTNVTVKWYSDAAGTNELTDAGDGTVDGKILITNSTNPQSVWAKVCSNASPFPCSALQEVTLNVRPQPTAIAGGPYTICSATTSVQLTGTYGGGATGGNWTGGSGSFGTPATNTTNKTVTISYTPTDGERNAGTVQLTFTSTGQATQCSPASQNVSVTINATPGNAQVSVTQPTCANSNGTVTVTSPLDGNGVDYEYSNNNGDWQDGTSFTVAAEGSYSIRVRNKSSQCISTTPTAGTLGAQPSGPSTPSVCVIQPSLCGPSTGKVSFTDLGAGYQYTINGTDWQDCPVFLNVVAGAVTSLKVKNSLGCQSPAADCHVICQSDPQECSATLRLTQRTSGSIATESTQFKVTAYPNPFHDQINFVVTSPVEGKGSLDVYNALGQKIKTVYQGKISKGAQNFEMRIPVRQQANLIYVLRVGDQQLTGKLLQLNR